MQERIIIVHGEKPLSSGQMHPEFIRRLDKCIEIAQPYDCIIITGGQTRKNAQPEAQQGQQYLLCKLKNKIILEKEARTTSENIRFVKKMILETRNKTFVAISSLKRIPRLKYLYKRLFPETRGSITFLGVMDDYSIWYSLVECCYFLFAVVDPQEKTIVRLFKKIFRNG